MPSFDILCGETLLKSELPSTYQHILTGFSTSFQPSLPSTFATPTYIFFNLNRKPWKSVTQWRSPDCRPFCPPEVATVSHFSAQVLTSKTG